MRRKLVGLGIAALTAFCTLAPTASAQFEGVSVGVSPGLSPAFNQLVTDYTTSCPTGRVWISADSPSGTLIRIDKLPVRSGQQSVSIVLRPGQRITVQISSGRSSAGYSFRCRPEDFPAFSAKGTLPSSSPFMAISQFDSTLAKNNKYAVVTDLRGTPLWWMPADSTPFNVESGGQGRIAYWSDWSKVRPKGAAGNGDFSIYGLDGRRERRLAVSGGWTDAHEALLTSRGTWYLESNIRSSGVNLSPFGGKPGSSVSQSLIEEISPVGKVIWGWRSKDHIPLVETPIRWWSRLFADWGLDADHYEATHFNSLAEDGHGGLIASFRHLDAIYRINKSTRGIDWKLGGTTTSKSLTVIGDSTSPTFGGQHDARVQPDGTITVFDNRTNLNSQPRVTRWRIDSAARTATLIEEFTDPDTLPAGCCGSARRFSDGSWLVSWGSTALIRAYDATHKQRFALTFDGTGFSYRATPITSAQASRTQLVAGMDKMHPR